MAEHGNGVVVRGKVKVDPVNHHLAYVYGE
jgi:hypothetical protein